MVAEVISLINGQTSDTFIDSGFSLFQHAHSCQMIVPVQSVFPDDEQRKIPAQLKFFQPQQPPFAIK